MPTKVRRWEMTGDVLVPTLEEFDELAGLLRRVVQIQAGRVMFASPEDQREAQDELLAALGRLESLT